MPAAQAVADVYRQGLGDFFPGRPVAPRSRLGRAPPVQQRLRLRRAGQPRTHAGAAPPPLQHGQLRWAAATSSPTSGRWKPWRWPWSPGTITTRDQAQAWLQFKGYAPSVLRLGTLTRLGGRVGSAHIAFDDHPGDQRFAGRIATTTVDSALAWLGACSWPARRWCCGWSMTSEIMVKMASSASTACASSY